jgi:hypothetical protein
MGDGITLAVLYRLIYGRARDRLGKFYFEQSPEAIRADPLACLGPVDPALAADPETAETIKEAVDDALAARRPR